VTDYAFGKLGWPCLWLSNAQDNHASRRIKERQGARLVDMMIGRFVGGSATRMVWQLTREDWQARQPMPLRPAARAPIHA
jgi:RimJ/RimL family protein N-acetyltransferase